MVAAQLTKSLELSKEKIAEARIVAEEAHSEMYTRQNRFIDQVKNFGNLTNVTEDSKPNANMVRNTDRYIREDYEALMKDTSEILFRHAERILKLGIFAQMDPEKMVLEDTPESRRTYMVLYALDTEREIYVGGINLHQEAVMAKDLAAAGLLIEGGREGNQYVLSSLGRAVAIKLHPPHHLEHVKREWIRR